MLCVNSIWNSIFEILYILRAYFKWQRIAKTQHVAKEIVSKLFEKLKGKIDNAQKLNKIIMSRYNMNIRIMFELLRTGFQLLESNDRICLFQFKPQS